MKSHRFDFSIGLVLAIGIIAINSLTLVDALQDMACINQDYDVMAITVQESREWLDNGRLQQIHGEWKEQIKNNSTSLPQPIAYGNQYPYQYQYRTIVGDDKILWRCLNTMTDKWLPTAWTTRKDDENSEQYRALCTDNNDHFMMITIAKRTWWVDTGKLQKMYEEMKKQNPNPTSLPKSIAYGNTDEKFPINYYDPIWNCWNTVVIERLITSYNLKTENPEVTCTDQDDHEIKITIKPWIVSLDNGRLQQIYEEWKEQKRADPTSLPRPIAYGDSNQAIAVADNITWRCVNTGTNRVISTKSNIIKPRKITDPPPNPLPPKVILVLQDGSFNPYEPFEYLVKHIKENRANH